MSKKKLDKIEMIQAVVALLIATVSGTIIWTNNSIDFLSKFGWNTINPGQAMVILMVILAGSLSWFFVSIAKRLR